MSGVMGGEEGAVETEDDERDGGGWMASTGDRSSRRFLRRFGASSGDDFVWCSVVVEESVAGMERGDGVGRRLDWRLPMLSGAGMGGTAGASLYLLLVPFPFPFPLAASVPSIKPGASRDQFATFPNPLDDLTDPKLRELLTLRASPSLPPTDPLAPPPLTALTMSLGALKESGPPVKPLRPPKTDHSQCPVPAL